MNNIYDTLFQDDNYDNHFFYTGRKNIIGLYHPDNYFIWGDNEDYLAYAKLATIKPIDVTKDVIVNETFEISVQIDGWGNPNIKDQYKEYHLEYPNSSVVKRFKQIVNNTQTGIVHLEGVINGGNTFITNTLSLTFMPYCFNQDTPKIDIPILLTYSTYRNKNNVDMPCYNLWIENKDKLYFDHAYEVSYKISTANIRSNSIDYLPANTPHTGSYYNISFCNENTADYRGEDWVGTYTTSETTVIRSSSIDRNIVNKITTIEEQINTRLPNKASCIINFDQIESFKLDPYSLDINNVDILDYTEEIIYTGVRGSFIARTPGMYTLQLQHESNISQEGIIEHVAVYDKFEKIKYLDITNSSNTQFISLPITLYLDPDQNTLLVKVYFTIENENPDISNYSSNTRLLITRE